LLIAFRAAVLPRQSAAMPQIAGFHNCRNMQAEDELHHFLIIRRNPSLCNPCGEGFSTTLPQSGGGKLFFREP
jgi:hypothetical protein